MPKDTPLQAFPIISVKLSRAHYKKTPYTTKMDYGESKSSILIR